MTLYKVVMSQMNFQRELEIPLESRSSRLKYKTTKKKPLIREGER